MTIPTHDDLVAHATTLAQRIDQFTKTMSPVPWCAPLGVNARPHTWDMQEDPSIPGIEFRPYYWGDDAVEAAKPNLKHGNVEVRWYKHPMRGSSLNVEAQPNVIIPWFESVVAAVHAFDTFR